MSSRHLSVEEMQQRVARFKELEPSKQAFVDSRIPAHRRDIFNVIGRGVTEDEHLVPAITDARDFNLTYVGAEPGRGAALHSHPTVEVFVAMTSRWAVYWGDTGASELILEPWDVISVPPGVMRGFRNVGDEYGHLMAILGGTESGHVDWPQAVLDQARKTGLERDARGSLVELGT